MRMLAAVLLSLATLPEAASAAPQRSSRGSTQDTSVQAWKTSLRRTISVHWEDTAWKDVARDLRLLLDLPIVVAKPLKDDDANIEMKLDRVRADLVLKMLRDNADVRFIVDRGILWITTPQDAVKRSAVLRMYDIRAITRSRTSYRPPRDMGLPGLRPDDDREQVEVVEGVDESEVVDLIQNGTGPANWELDGVSIQSMSGRLVVRHTPGMQRKVFKILLGLGAL